MIEGYKATDENMQCKGFQYTPNEWFEIPADQELKICEVGFHFCPHMSGVWNYYSAPGTRVFRVEVEGVADTPYEPGANLKKVCRRIRFTREILVGGNLNTGDRNTGNWNTGHSNHLDRNTGHFNTGNRNTGHFNTGDSNTGDRNTGDWNTGNSNTGDSNTGHSNTGDSNTGDWNTGNSNTGHLNTGNSNTGHSNTGNSNTGDWNTGHFNQTSATVRVFDIDSKLTHEKFREKFPEYYSLSLALGRDEPIPLEPYKNLPGITAKKLKSLHDKMIAARKEMTTTPG